VDSPSRWGQERLKERSLLMLKPEAVMRGLIGNIITRVENKGLNVTALKLLKLPREKAEALYAPHKGKAFYDDLIRHVLSGPVVAAVVEGPHAISHLRRMIGSTDPAESAVGTVRGDFGLILPKNVVHASDSAESAEREIGIFFEEDELVSYEKPTESMYLL